ncbi:uncharacterized protein LOC136027757 [Artemia franciscana]|uniref:uncharacterized protein LOC136027757 n=1 Tax=Artemia franciscana TaxID=6661 RepID=UPI0032DB7B4C
METTPILKGYNRDVAENYRPISIASAVGKVLESFMNSAVTKHLVFNEMLTSKEHSFRQGKLTETSLLDAYKYVTELVDQRVDVDVVLLDFAQAFDKVHPKRLEIKLHAIGINSAATS